MRFVKETAFNASAETVFAFHERPDAFELLLPPWQVSRLIQPPSSLAVGTRVIFEGKVGPVWQRFVAEHVAYEPGKRFVDRLLEGPFKSWEHEHVVTPTSATTCTLRDDITYELPLGLLGRVFGAPIARHQLERLFEHRHAVTRRICEASG